MTSTHEGSGNSVGSRRGAERDADHPCEPKCHGYGIGCGCSPRATGPLAGQFCGQQQPHAAHTWETPRTYGVMTLVSTYQCAGLLTSVTSPAVPEGLD